MQLALYEQAEAPTSAQALAGEIAVGKANGFWRLAHTPRGFQGPVSVVYISGSDLRAVIDVVIGSVPRFAETQLHIIGESLVLSWQVPWWGPPSHEEPPIVWC